MNTNSDKDVVGAWLDRYAPASFPANFVVVDTETTGIDRSRDWVCTVGLAVVQDGEITDIEDIYLDWFDFYEKRDDYATLGLFRDRLQSVQDVMIQKYGQFGHEEDVLRSGEPPDKALARVHAQLASYAKSGIVLVGHNVIKFDVPMLHRSIRGATGESWTPDSNLVFDSMLFEKFLLGNGPAVDAAGNMADWYSVASKGRSPRTSLHKACRPRYELGELLTCPDHTAGCDAELTALLVMAQMGCDGYHHSAA